MGALLMLVFPSYMCVLFFFILCYYGNWHVIYSISHSDRTELVQTGFAHN